MAVCVETVKKYGLDDFRSPVFIFERLCSIIYPVLKFAIFFLYLNNLIVFVILVTCFQGGGVHKDIIIIKLFEFESSYV